MFRVLVWMLGIASALLLCVSNASATNYEQQRRQAHPTIRKALKAKPCYAHYRAAHVTQSVQPVTPQIALAEGITGTVEVLVTVRATGTVIGAQAISGPVLLRRAAVDAALATTFVPEIRDCHPIPGAYSYFVDFSGG